MIESNGEGDSIIIDQVQLADLEDAAYVPPGSHIIGKLVGNEIWRSPEAHAEGPVNTPSDIFSFGVVVGISTPINSSLLRVSSIVYLCNDQTATLLC